MIMRLFKSLKLATSSFLSLVTLSAFLISCAKDHDLDDYKQEQFQKDYAKVASAAGRYSGTLKSNRTGETISALQITLSVDAKSVNSTDQSKDTVKPVIAADIEFAGNDDGVEVPASNAVYSPVSGLFHAELPIPNGTDPNMTALVINFTGTISPNGTLIGTMLAPGNDQHGANFSLTRGGDSIQSISKALPANSSTAFSKATTAKQSTHSYKGFYTDNQGTVAVTLNVVQPTRTRLEQIADLVVPNAEKYLSAYFELGNPQSYGSFSSLKWDTVNNRLQGTQAQPVNPLVIAHLTLDCEGFNFNSTANYNFTCDYSSSLNSRNAKLVFK
jgi:hypothetical protein